MLAWCILLGSICVVNALNLDQAGAGGRVALATLVAQVAAPVANRLVSVSVVVA